MRLFIALNFNKEILDSLWNIRESLKSYSLQGNFTRRENFHLTLVFLGEIAPSRIDSIKKVMKDISVERFTLSISGLGCFKRNGGDIYWLGVEKSNTLTELHNGLYRGLREAGFIIEQRDFRPHLTLGREIRLNGDFKREVFAEQLPVLSQEVEKISLMKSERISGKLTYTEVFGKYL